MGRIEVEAGFRGDPVGVFEFTIEGDTPNPEEMALIDGFMAEVAVEQERAGEQGLGLSRFAERVQTARGSAAERLQTLARRRRAVRLGRTVTEVGFGTAGSITGGLTGGPGGAILGGGIGAGLGSVTFDTATEALRAAGVFPPEGTDPGTAGEIARRGRNAATLDTLFGAGFTFAGPGARAAGRGLVGVGARAREAGAAARRLGVPLGIQEVSDRVAMRKFQNVLGLFPFLSQPFKEAGVRRALGVQQARRSVIGEIAPVTNMTRLGQELSLGIRATTGSARRSLSEGYERLMDDAAERGLEVVPENFKRESNRIISRVMADRPEVFGETVRGRAGQPLLDEFGRPIIQIAPRPTKPAVPSNVIPFLQRMQNLRTLNARQYQRLAQDLNELMGRAKSRAEFARAFEAKRALELDLGEVADPVFRTEYQRLNREFSELMTLLSGPTARRIRQVDPSVLGDVPAQARKKAVTNLYKAAFNFGAVDDIDDIYRLVEQDPAAFRKGLAFYLDDVVERATNQDKVATGAQRFIQRFTTGGVGDVDIVRFDVGKIRSELGLNDLGSDRAQALIRALDLAGRADHVAKINEFLSIADLAAQGGIPDVRQFLARHFTLAAGRGGLRRAASVMFGGGLVGTGAGAATSLSVPQALAIVYAGRRFGRFLTDPVALEAATESLRPTASAAVRRSAAARLFRVLPRLFDDEGEERPTSFDVLRELQAQRLTGGLQTGAGIQLSPRELLLQRSQTKGRP